MVIGYYCYGKISEDLNNFIQENGKIESSIWYRKLQLDQISKLGHEIYLMNEKKEWKKYKPFDCLKNSKTFSPGKVFSKLKWITEDGSIKLEKSWLDMYKHIDDVEWPKLDMLIIDNAGYPLFPIFTYKLLLVLAYKDKIPVVLLDDDNHTEKLFPRFNKVFGKNLLEDVFVATRYSKQNFPKQIHFPLAYDQSREQKVQPVKNLEHDYVYIGHDYDRRQKMIEFFFEFDMKYRNEFKTEIYGNWDKWLQTKKYSKVYPTDILKGPIAQLDGFNLLNKTLATCKVLPPFAEEYGHITGGFYEAITYGCPMLADKDIRTVEQYIIKDNIVSGKDEVYKRLVELKNQSWKSRKEMIEEQRKMFREFKIENIINNLFKQALK